MRLIDAVQVKIDDRTDIRQYVADCDDECIALLEEGVEEGSITVEPGLLGWGAYNVTLRDGEGVCYHAQVEED